MADAETFLQPLVIQPYEVTNNKLVRPVRGKKTISSAVAERLRDASCLSVVSFRYNTSSAIFYDYWLLRLHIYRYVQLSSALFSSLRRGRP